jgi:hypothetical protein
MRSRFVWMVGIAEVMICVAMSSGLPVTQERSGNSSELFSKLVWSVWLCGLPQFDRISLWVM